MDNDTLGNLVIGRKIGYGGIRLLDQDGNVVGEILIKRGLTNNEVRVHLRLPREIKVHRFDHSGKRDV